jgi:uncharacterized protein (TIGR02266 family)
MKSKPTSKNSSGPQIQAFIENRQYLRNPLIVLEVKWKRYDEVFLGSSENISLGGLFLSMDGPVRVGERFPLEFILPDRKTKIACTGEVSWTRQYASEGSGSQGVGIKFVDLSSATMKALETWMKKQGSPPKKKA